MIYALEGRIFKLEVDRLVLNVSNVYYEVLTPSLRSDLKLEQSLFLYIHHIIREDDEYLIGFHDLSGRDLFRALITVSGIGPKTALGILTATTIEELKTAIMNENLAFLKKLPGIGPKGASQIILDLKGKLRTEVGNSLNPYYDEVLTGLASLGFKKNDIKKVLNSFGEDAESANELFKKALGELRKL